jgi:hypothetical protein
MEQQTLIEANNRLEKVFNAVRDEIRKTIFECRARSVGLTHLDTAELWLQKALIEMYKEKEA